MDQKVFKQGLDIRRQVLGEAYVNQAMANMDAINAPLQELVTTYCWGECWGRPGLDMKTRSMLNLAMLSALNRSHEMRLHVNGALNNGVTEAEIMEVVFQVTIYCGVPAGVEASRIAREVFAQRKAESGAERAAS